jgi:hypothetical protein
MAQRKTAVLNIRIRPEIKESLKASADGERRSLANMVEVMIEEYVSKVVERRGKVGRIIRAG